MKVNYEIIETTKSEDIKSEIIWHMLHSFVDTDEWVLDKDFAVHEYEFEFKIKGKYDVKMNVEKFVDFIMEFNKDLIDEVNELRETMDKINKISEINY